jgi:hypothetical protein
VFFVPQWEGFFGFINLLSVNNILKFFSHINNVLNFFIYFLIGAKFRQESKDFLFSFKIFKCVIIKSINKIVYENKTNTEGRRPMNTTSISPSNIGQLARGPAEQQNKLKQAIL